MYAVAWALFRGVGPRCLGTCLGSACWATAPSVRMVGGRGSGWPSIPASMGWLWLGPGDVFCGTVS